MSGEWTHIVTGGPWPERVGKRCRLVPDPGDGIYPFGKRARDEVIILIEDDPFTDQHGVWCLRHDDSWSCSIGLEDIIEAKEVWPSETWDHDPDDDAYEVEP